jgi:hypothetical protein
MGELKDILSVAGGNKELKISLTPDALLMLVGGIFIAVCMAVFTANLIAKKL